MGKVPLAYFITFRTYGTWLHGDARGSVGRRGPRGFGDDLFPADPVRQEVESAQLKAPPFVLDRRMREVVEAAVREICLQRGWPVFACNARTEHVHVVASGEVEPERMMHDFKAYATRVLRAECLVEPGRRLWSRHGSTRYVWDEDGLEVVIEYVLERQGGGRGD